MTTKDRAPLDLSRTLREHLAALLVYGPIGALIGLMLGVGAR